MQSINAIAEYEIRAGFKFSEVLPEGSKRKRKKKEQDAPAPETAAKEGHMTQGHVAKKAPRRRPAKEEKQQLGHLIQCPDCDYTNAYQGNVNRHWDKHHNPKPRVRGWAGPDKGHPDYKETCKYCIQGFFQHQDLRNHLLSSAHREYPEVTGPEAASPEGEGEAGAPQEDATPAP